MLKRVLLVIASLVVFVVVGGGVVMASIFTGNEPMPPSGPIAGGKAILLNDDYVAAFAIPTGDKHVALVDCGNDVEGKAVLGYLQGQQLVVDGVFLTHAHPDHTNGCAAIAKAFPDAFFAASADELPTLTGKAAFKGFLTGMAGAKDSGVVVSKALGDGDDTVVGSVTIKAFAVPGHTAGSMMYLADGVLFVGDAATGASDGHIKGPPRPFTDDLAQAIASLHAVARTLASSTVNTFAFAHSGPMPADLQKILAIQ
jgi:glyoxylase-like metal-dependent hydrolase (beta-lactamase superfamily II)